MNIYYPIKCGKIPINSLFSSDFIIRYRIFLISKTFTTIAKDKEKWFGVHYKQEYLPEEFFTVNQNT